MLRLRSTATRIRHGFGWRWIVSYFLVAVAASAVNVAPHPDAVTLVALILNPSAYDAKPVRVSGFAVFEYEESAIYLSKNDAVLGLDANSVALATGRKLDVLQSLHGRYVIVAGTFRLMEGAGGKRGYIGSITLLDPSPVLREFPAAVPK